MLWNSGPWSSRRQDSPKTRRAAPVLISCLAILFAFVLAVSGFADEKRLSVYSGATSYSLTVREKNGTRLRRPARNPSTSGLGERPNRWPVVEAQLQRLRERIHSREDAGAGAGTDFRSYRQLPSRKRARPCPAEFGAVAGVALPVGSGKFPRGVAAIVHRQHSGPLHRPGEQDESSHPGDELHVAR